MILAPGYVLVDNCNLYNRERLMQQGYTHVVADTFVSATGEILTEDGIDRYVRPVKFPSGVVPDEAVRIIDLDGSGEVSYLADKGFVLGDLEQKYRSIDLRAAWELQRRGFHFLLISKAYVADGERDVDAVIPVTFDDGFNGRKLISLKEFDREPRTFKVLSCYFDAVAPAA